MRVRSARVNHSSRPVTDRYGGVSERHKPASAVPGEDNDARCSDNLRHAPDYDNPSSDYGEYLPTMTIRLPTM